jgi:hypothetical protein
MSPARKPGEAVDHPDHYNAHPAGVECVDVAEWLNFNLGNALKYLWRAGQKGKRCEDLSKAVWYLEREAGRGVAAFAGCDMGGARAAAWPDGDRDRFLAGFPYLAHAAIGQLLIADQRLRPAGALRNAALMIRAGIELEAARETATPNPNHWRTVLGLDPDEALTEARITAAYRERSAANTLDGALQARLLAARDTARQALRLNPAGLIGPEDTTATLADIERTR